MSNQSNNNSNANAKCISVQDKINLYENLSEIPYMLKEIELTSDDEKRRKLFFGITRNVVRINNIIEKY